VKRNEFCEEMQLKMEEDGFVERLISMKPQSTSVAR
jgi:hypothetical protein